MKTVASQATRIRSTCPPLDAVARECVVSWQEYDRTWKGTVYVERGGPDASPVERWELAAKSKAHGAPTMRLRKSGRVLVATRRARIGQPLELLTYGEPDALISFGAPTDPWTAPNEWSTPPAGTRWVAFPATVTAGPGTKRLSTTAGLARVVLADGVETVEATGESGCYGSFDMAPGETRQACALFSVPLGVGWSQLEWSAGEETGVWLP